MASDLTGRQYSKRTRSGRRSYRIRDRLFLRLKRRSRNLSQADLASSIGVSRSAVTHWESGANPCIESVYAERMAVVLDEPLHALFVQD